MSVTVPTSLLQSSVSEIKQQTTLAVGTNDITPSCDRETEPFSSPDLALRTGSLQCTETTPKPPEYSNLSSEFCNGSPRRATTRGMAKKARTEGPVAASTDYSSSKQLSELDYSNSKSTNLSTSEPKILNDKIPCKKSLKTESSKKSKVTLFEKKTG